VLKKDSVVNSLIFLVYSAWSLSVQGLDWAKLEAAKKDSEKKTQRELRIIKLLKAERPRGII